MDENQNQPPQQLIVNHHVAWPRILFILVTLLGIAAGTIATLTITEFRSKAAVDSPSPTPFVEIVSPPKNPLATPYIRLVTQKENYGLATSIPVDVYLKNPDLAAMETTLVITYDPQVLEISEEDITSTDIFKVFNIDSFEDGKITLSLFINPQVGHSPVQLNSEKKIAQLNFKSRTLPATTDVALEFDPDSTKGTTLIKFSEARVENPENNLKAVEGIQLTIQ